MTFNIRALVVEDDAHQLVVITQILRNMGVACKRNTSGLHVLEQIQGMSPLPDILILELDLVQCDPFAICAALRQDTRSAHIPVITVGSETWRYQQDRLHAAGCAGLICKPISNHRLERFIHQALADQDLWQEHA